MKTLSIMFLCFVTGMAVAQKVPESETITVTPVKKGEEPKAVMDAIKADFPNAIASDLSFLPAKLYGEQWAVSEKNDMTGKPDFYQITLKEGKEYYRAVYSTSGNLLSSKFIIPKAKLPSDVLNAISTKYPGWKVTSDSEKIEDKNGEYKAIYHVLIEQNKEHRNLYIADGGQLIKDKKRT